MKLNWGPFPGKETHGIPKPTNCSVAVPAFATPTSPQLAQEENWLKPINISNDFFFHISEIPNSSIDSLVDLKP